MKPLKFGGHLSQQIAYPEPYMWVALQYLRVKTEKRSDVAKVAEAYFSYESKELIQCVDGYIPCN